MGFLEDELNDLLIDSFIDVLVWECRELSQKALTAAVEVGWDSDEAGPPR